MGKPQASSARSRDRSQPGLGQEPRGHRPAAGPGRATAGGGGCPAPQHTARAVSTGHSLILASAAPSGSLPSGTCAFLSDSAQGAHVHHTAQAMGLPLPARDTTSQPPPTARHVLLLCLRPPLLPRCSRNGPLTWWPCRPRLPPPSIGTKVAKGSPLTGPKLPMSPRPPLLLVILVKTTDTPTSNPTQPWAPAMPWGRGGRHLPLHIDNHRPRWPPTCPSSAPRSSLHAAITMTTGQDQASYGCSAEPVDLPSLCRGLARPRSPSPQLTRPACLHLGPSASLTVRNWCVWGA